MADKEAKNSAPLLVSTPEIRDSDIREYPPHLSEKEMADYQNIGGTCEDGKWKLHDGRELLPKEYSRMILKRLHQQTHWGSRALAEQF